MSGVLFAEDAMVADLLKRILENSKAKKIVGMEPGPVLLQSDGEVRRLMKLGETNYELAVGLIFIVKQEQDQKEGLKPMVTADNLSSLLGCSVEVIAKEFERYPSTGENQWSWFDVRRLAVVRFCGATMHSFLGSMEELSYV